jgi:hypothetical protein
MDRESCDEKQQGGAGETKRELVQHGDMANRQAADMELLKR